MFTSIDITYLQEKAGNLHANMLTAVSKIFYLSSVLRIASFPVSVASANQDGGFGAGFRAGLRALAIRE